MMLPTGLGIMLLSICASADAALIPRSLLFGPPDRDQPAISPDGEHLSFLAPVDGVKSLWIAPTEAPDQVRLLVRGTDRIGQYRWAYTNHHILYEATRPDESGHVWCVDTQTGQNRDLTPGEEVSATILDVSSADPDGALLLLRESEGTLPDAYRVEIATGALTCVARDEGFVGWMVDRSATVAMVLKLTSEGELSCLTRSNEDGWQELLSIPYEDMLTTRPVEFDTTGQYLHMLDSRGRDTSAVTQLNTQTHEVTVLGECPGVDVDQVLTNPQTGAVEAFGCNSGQLRWHPLSPVVAPHLERLQNTPNSQFEVVSRSLDSSLWVISRTDGGAPPRYCLYDCRTSQERPLFSSREKLQRFELAPMEAVVIKARDGLDLVSYLTLPPGTQRQAGSWRPATPLPMVLKVHGGPWTRDKLGYEPWGQWLANRGYAVLAVNFRGSTGFGKEFANAGNRQWGRKMQDDLIDAVRWAVGQGVADPARVAIIGGSYGGYATLMALALAPDTFVCGVDVVGPVNLITFLESLPASHQAKMEFWKRALGDRETPEGRAQLLADSPITHVDSIRAPLLIAHGDQDPRCKRSQSDEMVAALERRGVPTVYVVYPDEGHGFERTENKTCFFAVSELFLAKYLGGRCEPLAGALAGSSIQVPVGADQLPELADMLNGAGAD